VSKVSGPPLRHEVRYENEILDGPPVNGWRTCTLSGRGRASCTCGGMDTGYVNADVAYRAAHRTPSEGGLTMPARYRSAHDTINWHGTDDDTPPGHCTAIGTDSLGVAWLWLFQGDKPSDDAFVGAISIPKQANQIPNAYGRGGGFAGLAKNTRDVLERLANRSAEETST
jgi:hypothetical protein